MGEVTKASGDSGKQPRARGRLGRLRPFLDVLPAAILCLLAIWEIIAIARSGSDTGTDAEWARAAEIVREQWQVGDLVVFAPAWIDPVGRAAVGELLSIDDAARMDAARYTVVWELSIRSSRAAETRGRKLEESVSAGPIAIRKWVGERVVVTADLREALAGAEIRSSPAGRPRLSLEEVGFAPHRCVLSTPKPGETVEIEYRDLELGTELVGYAGLGDVFTRRDIRDPGAIEVLVNGEVAVAVSVGVEDGWVRFAAKTSPGPATVLVRLTATAAKRRICFAAEARR